MAKCGCAQGSCFCRFADSDTVEFSGSGSQSDPFLALPKPLITVGSTSTLALTLEIAGDTASLGAQPLLGGNVDVFTADGTWNKPPGVTFARVLMIGGGGGGASGRSNTGSPGANSHGGSGGDAGQVVTLLLIDTEIPASAAVVIGQGGLGGASVSGANGLVGADGGDTEFGDYLCPGGSGGQINGAAPTHGPLGMPPGQRAVSGDLGDNFNPAHYYLAPGAGGHAASVPYGIVASPGGYSHPGQGSRYPDNTGGGAVGEDGRDEPVTKMGGGGGGGDGAIGGGFHGGNGGLYGGGGGGGGWAGLSNPSGKGGDGADGLVVVISW